MLSGSDKALRVTGDHLLLTRPYDKDAAWLVGFSDVGIGGGVLVFLRIQMHVQALQPFAHATAKRCRVFANSRRENQRIDATECHRQRANGGSNSIREHVDRQLRLLIARLRRHFDFAKVR